MSDDALAPGAPRPLLDGQRIALDRLHAGWLAPIDATLIDAARASPLGRRWLASRLARVAPALFARPHRDALPIPAAGLRPDDDSLLELGATALAPWWRGLVQRQAVALLHGALGDARYERLLRRPSGAERRATDLTPLLPDSVAELHTLMLRQGVSEWRASLGELPDAVREAIALSVDPLLWREPPPARLAPERVHELLSRPATELAA